jgi:hypothetical protein
MRGVDTAGDNEPKAAATSCGAVGEWLAVAGNAGSISLDRHRIGDDDLDQVSALTDGDSLPVFVTLELRKREPIRHLHSVLVLRGNGPAAQEGERDRRDHNRRK